METIIGTVVDFKYFNNIGRCFIQLEKDSVICSLEDITVKTDMFFSWLSFEDFSKITNVTVLDYLIDETCDNLIADNYIIIDTRKELDGFYVTYGEININIGSSIIAEGDRVNLGGVTTEYGFPRVKTLVCKSGNCSVS